MANSKGACGRKQSKCETERKNLLPGWHLDAWWKMEQGVQVLLHWILRTMSHQISEQGNR